jgi:hypothetical protein
MGRRGLYICFSIVSFFFNGLGIGGWLGGFVHCIWYSCMVLPHSFVGIEKVYHQLVLSFAVRCILVGSRGLELRR